jgi:hypothetical protein
MMTSSLVARVKPGVTLEVLSDRLAARPALTVGPLVDGRHLALVLEAGGAESSEAETRWLAALDEIDDVAVVAVDFGSPETAR